MIELAKSVDLFYSLLLFFRRIKKEMWYVFIIYFLLFSSKSLGQKNIATNENISEISLNEILYIAAEKSLNTFKAKNQYGAKYWEFKSFKSSLLPKIEFELRPFTFNRSVVQRFDSEQNIEVFRSQQTLNSFANISLSQNISATGGTVFLNSNFNRLVNFGDLDIENYSVAPIRIGFNQPLMAFNNFKWANKIEPLKYEKSKQDLIYELQNINLEAIELFFNWALSHKKVDIAKENKLSTSKLFKIGKKRYDLGSIEKDDLLNLELDVYNANTNLTQTQKELEKDKTNILLFLRDDSLLYTVPKLPELISKLQINIDNAMSLARENNPRILELKLKKIEALRDLDRIIKENRFELSFNASYGLNQRSSAFRDAYSNFLDQQSIAVQFKVPILDWGERKGNIKTAKINKEVTEIEVQQAQDKFKQEIALKITDFNLQEQLVSVALRSSEISRVSYKITEKRFLSGRIDLLKLTSARKAWQTASENYIRSLHNYWRFYYEVQQITLYDFLNKRTLKEDFEKIIAK